MGFVILLSSMQMLHYVIKVLCEQKTLLEEKLLPHLQHSFISSEENVVLCNISTVKIALVFCMPCFVLGC